MGDIFKRAKGSGYTIRWYEGGRRRVLATKQTTHADAKRMLLEIEARVARGETGIPERCTWPTVAELIDRFLREYTRPRLKDLDAYRANTRTRLQKVLPLLGRLSTGGIQSSDISRMRDALSREYEPGTVCVCLATLSAVFSWAVREGLASSNPCRGVERPTPARSLDFLTRDEVKRLLEAAAACATTPTGCMLHIGIALAVHTGLRKGELFGLRWIDLDFETRRLTVARSYHSSPKSGKARHLRLPQSLVPLLKAWRERCPQSKDGRVLPVGAAGGRWAMLGLPRLMAEIGLRPALHPWHLLRHTMASHFVMAGGNILALQKILGHSDIKVTLIYAHLAPDYLGDEIDKLKF